MTWFFENLDHIAALTWRHVWLSLIPTLAGFLIAVPLGWLGSRNARWRGILLGAGSISYSIPSLPLFVILPGIMGTQILNPINVIVALTIYAVAVMLRSSCDAFSAVSTTVLDAASATGYSNTHRALSVQLPLAGPVLLAGMRVVSVSTVSLVSVGAVVGVSSLGSLFTNGFQRAFGAEIVIGVIGTVVLALVFDAIIVWSGRLLMPWTQVGVGS